MPTDSKPRVWNRRDPNVPADAVYVGRPSIWGNPYREGRDGTRAEVIELFRRHVANHPDMRLFIKHQLRGKHLVCWCAPLPCHADVLFQIANGYDWRKGNS